MNYAKALFGIRNAIYRRRILASNGLLSLVKEENQSRSLVCEKPSRMEKKVGPHKKQRNVGAKVQAMKAYANIPSDLGTKQQKVGPCPRKSQDRSFEEQQVS